MTIEPSSGAPTPDPARLAAARAALVVATESAHSSADQSRATARPRPDQEASPRAGDHALGEAAIGRSQGLADARQIALRQLAIGPRSRHQLSEKMTGRGCDPADIAEVLDRMTDVGLVDDAAYAEMFVRTKREGSGLAATALRHELRKKGVPAHLAEQAITQEAPEDERFRAQELVQGRLRRMAGLDREVKMRRLAGLLARKGYPPGMAISVVREAVDALPEHRRD